MEHLKKGKDKNISDLSQIIFNFKRALQVFQMDIIEKTFNYFPPKKVISESDILLNDFEEQFLDLEALKP